MPIFYECQRCTACCRWPGSVRVTDDEIARMAAFLGLTEDDFIQRHLRLRPDRRGLSLAEKPNGECAFLDGNDCRVQPVKPQQCRDFPNLWNFPGFEKVCHAIPHRMSDEEFERRTGASHDPGERSNNNGTLPLPPSAFAIRQATADRPVEGERKLPPSHGGGRGRVPLLGSGADVTPGGAGIRK